MEANRAKPIWSRYRFEQFSRNRNVRWFVMDRKCMGEMELIFSCQSRIIIWETELFAGKHRWVSWFVYFPEKGSQLGRAASHHRSRAALLHKRILTHKNRWRMEDMRRKKNRCCIPSGHSSTHTHTHTGRLHSFSGAATIFPLVFTYIYSTH